MRRSEGRLLVYLLLVQTAAQIAGPYFTPYMLKTVQFSYWQYMALMATSFGMKVLTLPAFGSLAHRYGARRLLWIGGLGIIPVSGLWVVSDSFWFLIGVQVIAGTTWAAYELAMFLLFFESIRAEERTSVLTTFNFANSLATCVGSLLGGLLLATLGKTQHTYLLLFGLSSVARLGTVVALFRVPQISFESKPIGIRTLGVQGNGGSLDQPILSSLKDNGGSAPVRQRPADLRAISGHPEHMGHPERSEGSSQILRYAQNDEPFSCQTLE
jgi:MFS family permease